MVDKKQESKQKTHQAEELSLTTKNNITTQEFLVQGKDSILKSLTGSNKKPNVIQAQSAASSGDIPPSDDA